MYVTNICKCMLFVADWFAHENAKYRQADWFMCYEDNSTKNNPIVLYPTTTTHSTFLRDGFHSPNVSDVTFMTLGIIIENYVWEVELKKQLIYICIQTTGVLFVTHRRNKFTQVQKICIVDRNICLIEQNEVWAWLLI